MGEARRRGTLKERKKAAKGPNLFVRALRHVWRFATKEDMVRNRNPIPKRERAKRKRAFKRHHGLTRRQCGAIGAGHMERPVS